MSPPERGGDIVFASVVRLSICPSVTQRCPLYNLKNVQDIFMNYKASSDDMQNTRTVTLVRIVELFPFEIQKW